MSNHSIQILKQLTTGQRVAQGDLSILGRYYYVYQKDYQFLQLNNNRCNFIVSWMHCGPSRIKDYFESSLGQYLHWVQTRGSRAPTTRPKHVYVRDSTTSSESTSHNSFSCPYKYLIPSTIHNNISMVYFYCFIVKASQRGRQRQCMAIYHRPDIFPLIHRLDMNLPALMECTREDWN